MEYCALLKKYCSAGEEFCKGDLSEVAAELEYYSGSLLEALGVNDQAAINLSRIRITKKKHNRYQNPIMLVYALITRYLFALIHKVLVVKCSVQKQKPHK